MDVWEVDDELDVEFDALTAARVTLIEGDLSVRAAEGEARLEVHRHSGEPVEVTLHDGILTVTHEQPRGFHRTGNRATVVLTVSPTIDLRARTTSASVFVDGISGPTKLRTVSGVIVATALGEAEVESTSGAIEVLDVTGPLRAHSVSGSVTVARGRCPSLEARSTSGEILLDIEPAPGGRYTCDTVSGAVAVRLPSSASARVEANSISGRLDSNFDLEADHRRPARRRMSGSIGAGEAELWLNTVSGPVAVLQRGPAA
jgi:hypothetical protein